MLYHTILYTRYTYLFSALYLFLNPFSKSNNDSKYFNCICNWASVYSCTSRPLQSPVQPIPAAVYMYGRIWVYTWICIWVYKYIMCIYILCVYVKYVCAWVYYMYLYIMFICRLSIYIFCVYIVYKYHTANLAVALYVYGMCSHHILTNSHNNA